MKLAQLFKEVQEKNLTKEQLEDYHADLSGLYGQIQLELADVRKLKAVFFVEQTEKTAVATETKWQASQKGLREIELSHYAKGTEKILSSLKSRLYSVY